MADVPPEDPGPTPRRYPRRTVIAAAGVGLGAAVGYSVSRALGGSDGGGGAGPASTATPDATAPPTTDRRDRRREDRDADREARRAERRRQRAEERGEAADTTATTEPAADEHVEHEAPATPTSARSVADGPWSAPATWGGQVPVESDVVAVDHQVTLDVDAVIAGAQIGPGGGLTFDPRSGRHLTATGNVVVAGRMVMRPSSATVAHRLTFSGVDEARFVGGHSEAPLETDVGLWAVGAGILELQGAAKRPWTNLAGGVQRGDRTITVEDAAGWLVGDEIVVTPTEPTDVEDHWEHHDRRQITSVRGTTIGLDRPLDHPHPEVTVRDGVVHRAEVLNLSRNVVISGTPEGRSHVIMLSTTHPQQLAYVGLHDMGPRRGDEEVLGRYAIHFHADADGSRGSVLEGVAVYDSTGHAFAAHLSNGITFRECVAHDLVDDAFWWDLSLDGRGRDLVPSHDILYERCVAHLVKSGANSKFNLTGFLMGAGNGNVARGCVATGVQGGAESSAGFHWPSLSRDDNIWTFEANLAHNNHHSGIYFWQNGSPRTLVDGFTAYHCGQGIFAGAYANLVSYRDCTIYACEDDGLIVSALPARDGERTDETITFRGMYVDQAGRSEFAVRITKHLSRGGRVTEVSGSTFKGGTKAQVGLPDGGKHPQLYDFDACTFEGNAFWLGDGLPVETELRVVGDGERFIVRRADQPGEPRPEWNASVAPS